MEFPSIYFPACLKALMSCDHLWFSSAKRSISFYDLYSFSLHSYSVFLRCSNSLVFLFKMFSKSIKSYSIFYRSRFFCFNLSSLSCSSSMTTWYCFLNGSVLIKSSLYLKAASTTKYIQKFARLEFFMSAFTHSFDHLGWFYMSFLILIILFLSTHARSSPFNFGKN